MDTAVHFEVAGGTVLGDERAQTLDLIEHAGDELLPTKARIDGHAEHEIDIAQDLLKDGQRGRRIDGHARALAKLVDALNRAVEVRRDLLMQDRKSVV